MKNMTFIALFTCSLTLITTSCFAGKKEKHNNQNSTYSDIAQQYEKEYGDQLIESSSPSYQPNPVILDGVGQIMNGALSIAQNPHSRPNIGHSVAAMIYGIMRIIVEKIAHKKMHPAHLKTLEECCDEICADISKEITEIIVTKNYMIE